MSLLKNFKKNIRSRRFCNPAHCRYVTKRYIPHPQNAIRQHCRYALKRGIPHPQNPEKNLYTNVAIKEFQKKFVKPPLLKKFYIFVLDFYIQSWANNQNYFNKIKGNAPMVVGTKEPTANALRMWKSHLRGRCYFIAILII